MQDFYSHFKVIFDLKQASFINFIDKYIEAGNYYKKYDSFHLIREYFESIDRKFISREDEEKEFKVSLIDSEDFNIFEWNNDTIINDLKEVLNNFTKINLEKFYLIKFFEFLLEDIENEFKVIEGYQNFYELQKSYDMKDPEHRSYIKNSIQSVRTNKQLLENLRIEYTQITSLTNSTNIKSNKIEMSEEKNLSSTKLIDSNSPPKLIWKGSHTDLTFLIDELIRLELIASHKNINKLISQHFTWVGSEIKPKEIADLKNKIKNKNYPLSPSREIKELTEKITKKEK